MNCRTFLPLELCGLVASAAIFLSGCTETSHADRAAEKSPSTVNAAAPSATRSSATPAQAAGVGDWPEFRGPLRDGISRETGWSTEWPADGPKQVWKGNVGIGFSSVSVVDNRLFTMGHKDGIDTVYCLNANTGEEIWKHSYPCAIVDNLHEGGPAVTPTIDGNRVYTVSKEGHLFCLDLQSGGVLWQLELQKAYEAKMPEWGFSGSPLVIGEKLIVDAGPLVAMNKEDGKPIWKTQTYRPGYGSPVRFERDGVTLIAHLNNDALIIVKADDGAIVASSPFETQYVTTGTSPVLDGNTIFISSGYNRGCILFELAGSELKPIYENKKMRNHMATSVAWEEHLYGIDGNSHDRRNCSVVCLENASGEQKWKERGLGCGSLMISDGKLIVFSDEGELVVAPISTEKFEPLAKAKVLDGRCWTSPVLAKGKIYCRNAAGDLVCVDVSG
jgi:outer membrane protein assembly factor BamB